MTPDIQNGKKEKSRTSKVTGNTVDSKIALGNNARIARFKSLPVMPGSVAFESKLVHSG